MMPANMTGIKNGCMTYKNATMSAIINKVSARRSLVISILFILLGIVLFDTFVERPDGFAKPGSDLWQTFSAKNEKCDQEDDQEFCHADAHGEPIWQKNFVKTRRF